ncbi:hypothetical protein [Streptomyces sp. NPDC048663]|uniref:hypothetical protein n=1 Tax=Streptomyces sp. NPDC048663 TaxID=3155638 RepID=UPI003428AB47
MSRRLLLWAALVAVLVVLASAEYELAVACGFGTYVAAGVPAALDVYAIAALQARRDVLLVVAALIAVNAASHLVAVGLLPVSVVLVVAVSAIAPLVLWRVHRLAEPQAEPVAVPAEPVSSALPEPAPEVAEQVTVERDQELTDAVPVGPVLGPWRPVAELAGGTGGTDGGTGPDLLDDHFVSVAEVIAEPLPEPAPEPVPPPVPVLVPDPGTGAADITSEDTSNTTFEARVATVRNWLETEPELKGPEIGQRLDVSDGYGRRLLRAARGDA